MDLKFEESIKKALELLCARPGQKITSDLIESWSIGLTGVSPRYIMRAAYSFLQDKDTDYLPAPGKVRAICKRLKVADLNKYNKEHSTEEYSEENRKFSKVKAKEIYTGLQKNIPAFNKIKTEKINLMEYTDQRGETVKIIAYGHHNIDDFNKNCFNQFLEKPSKTFHGYHRERRKTDSSGKKYMTMEQCASNVGGTPITIGII